MILSGKTVAEKIHKEIQETVTTLPSPPGLAVILVGDHPSSRVYVHKKEQALAQVGMRSFPHYLPQDTKETELLQLIEQLNQTQEVDGILVQLPLPSHINTIRIIETIAPTKDVDGFHPLNMGKLLLGLEDGFIPCTPLGIHTLLRAYQIEVEGKRAVIVGRSQVVGRPLAALLMQNKPGLNATVTVVHSKSNDLKGLIASADILIAAIGRARFIQAEMVKKGAVVIDVGINREKDPSSPKGYRIVGDVDFQEVAKKCLAITPVPNGVGPMTVAMLLSNTLASYQRKHA